MASASWNRRNARARALGYESYYDYRVHGYGRTPPEAPRARGERLAELRGHRGRADFRRALRSDEVARVTPVPGERNRRGQFSTYDLEVEMTDGTTRTYSLRGKQMSKPQLRRLARDIQRAGVDYLPDPYLVIPGLEPPNALEA